MQETRRIEHFRRPGTAAVTFSVIALCLIVLAALVSRHRQASSREKSLAQLQANGLIVIEDRGLITVSFHKVDDVSAAQIVALNESAKYIDFFVGDDSSLTDSQLEFLALAKRIQSVSLQRTSIKGYGLKHLRDSNVKHLYLQETEVENHQLNQLRSIKTLETLSLANTGVTTEGLAHLVSLPRLSHLALENCSNLDAAKLGRLFQEFKALKQVGLSENDVSKDRLEEISVQNENIRFYYVY